MAKEKAAELAPQLLTLREGAAYLGVTDQRMRTILREGRVDATKNEKGYWRVTPEVLDNYQSTKGRRLDGAKAWVARMTDEQKVVLEDFIAIQGEGWEEVVFAPRYNYDPEKAKAYRQKRKAQLAEETAAMAEGS